jgi:hypothetical protein
VNSLLAISGVIAQFIQAHGPVVVAVTSGIAAVLAKNYESGVEDFLQALALLFGGLAAIQFHGELRAIQKTFVADCPR